ncbi:MAG: hypothetical protein A3F10_04600 [Coxiella sp. RIFCSPHIGHO2_12_FULL_42_15]|nr:MAG: hypothetical protein A3F10_04600 [Coxiella sp. RIFCSPHIGHO2_12_FULL_42_15]
MTTSLSAFSQQFLLWREQAKQGRIPNILKKQIISLLQAHSEQELSQHLGIPLKTLRKWQKYPVATMLGVFLSASTVLEKRHKELPAPAVMSDALSRNTPSY